MTPAPALAQTTKYYGLFVQDVWKLTPRLTVNLGLRYEYESPRTDRFNQLSNFDFNVASPLKVAGLDLKGGLTFPGTGSQPRTNANADRNNIGPRAGIAFKLANHTVLRTGGGLFYAGLTGLGGGAAAFGVSGYAATTSIVTSQDGVNPLVNWSNPYPNGFNKPTGSSLGLSTLLGQSVQYFDRSNVSPYSGQWNFNIQQELPKNILFEVGYAGSRGLNQFENRQFNQLRPDQLALGDKLRETVPNPFFGQITVGTLASATVARAQLLRPFPQYDAVTSQNGTWGSSNYHALEMKTEKRYATGLSILVSYTWSKMMETGNSGFSGETLGSGGFQNWYNLAADKSVSISDQTHRFILNAVYELPFFKSSRGVTKAVLGGWQLSGIWSAFSGGPLGIASNVNNTFSQGGGQRPNWSGVSAKIDNPTPLRWFDTAQFTNPPNYTFGNAGRTFNDLRSQGTKQVDATISKNFKIKERLTLQFRSEFFNLSNTVRFAPPNTSLGNVQFGQVSAQGNQPRVIQFSLKLIG